MFSSSNVKRRLLCLRAIASFVIHTAIPCSFLFTGCTSTPEEITPSPSPMAAVTLTEEEVQNYAKAILDIEPIRQASLGQVQTLTPDGVAPILSCNQPQTLVGLSPEIRAVIVTFCTQAKEISTNYGLTPTRFNAITSNLPTDAALKTQITQALVAQLGQQ